MRGGAERAVWGPHWMTPPPSLVSPQSLAEGPPFQLQPSRLGPTEEELPPPPDESIGFPEREASTGMGSGLGGFWEVPGGPQGASLSFQVGTGTAGTTGVLPSSRFRDGP